MSSKNKSNMWLFKYLWFIAIMPKELQCIVLLGIAAYLLWKKKWKLKLDAFSILIIIYASIHVVSILLNCIRTDYEPARIIAAFNTAIIWYVAIVFYVYYKNSNTPILDVAKYGFINNTVMIVLAFVARYMGHITEAWTLPVTHSVLFVYDGWFSRFFGFMEFSTLVVGFILSMIPWALYFIIHSVSRPLRIPLATAYYVLAFFPIYISYSRSGYLLFWIGACGIIFLGWKINTGTENKKFLLSAAIVLLFLSAIPLSECFAAVVQKLLAMREGSNSTRMEIYRESMECFRKSPLIGCGVKVIGRMGYPLGSHSSYLGFLYKAGIIGTLAAMAALIDQAILLLKKLLKSRQVLEAICLLFVLLMFGDFIFEDIDGCDWLTCIWFAAMGLLRRGHVVHDHHQGAF